MSNQDSATVDSPPSRPVLKSCVLPRARSLMNKDFKIAVGKQTHLPSTITNPSNKLSKKLRKDYLFEKPLADLSSEDEHEGFKGIKFLKPEEKYRMVRGNLDPVLIIFTSESTNFMTYSYGPDSSDSSEI